MKKFLSIIFAAAALLSCSKIDGDELIEKINGLDERVSALENFVNLLNGDVTSLQNLYSVAVKGVYIAKVEETAAGYSFLLSDGSSVEVRNGKDGETPRIPAVGLKQDADGIYYWTLDGQWLNDTSGKKIPAQSATPQFRMSGVYLQVSYDNGGTWNTLCEISGGGTTPAVKQVEVTEDSVTFTLADNTTISLPRSGSTMSIEIAEGETLTFTAGQKIVVNYVVNNAPEAVKVSVLAGGNWTAKAIPSSTSAGTIEITAPDPISEAEILVFAYSRNLVAMASILCKDGPSPVPTDHIVKAVISGTSTVLAQIEGTSSYSGTVTVPAKTEFTITVDDVEYGFMKASGNGGLGHVTSAAAALPLSLLPTSSSRVYNVTKSVGLMVALSDSGNKFWTDLPAASQAKITVTIAGEKISYRLDLLKNDPAVLWEEDFSLFSFGSDYIAACLGYVLPSGITPPLYDGLTPSSEMTTDIANGAEAFDYPTKVKLAVASEEYAACRDIIGWDVNYMAEHPCCASFGAYKGSSFAKTPAFAGSYQGDVVVEFGMSRFSDSAGPVYVNIVGGGKFVSGTSTLDGVSGSQIYDSFAESDTQIGIDNNEWCPNPGKTDVDKPVSHFSFVVTGVTADTRILFDAPIPSKIAPRFYLHDIKVSKR